MAKHRIICSGLAYSYQRMVKALLLEVMAIMKMELGQDMFKVYIIDGIAIAMHGPKWEGDIEGEAACDYWHGRFANISGDGKTLAVGRVVQDGCGSSSGNVRVFVWSGSTWV